MAYLFNLAYLVAVVLASPWLLWAAAFRGKYREGWNEKLLGHVPFPPGYDTLSQRIWFHAVSVGEVQMVGKLLKRCDRRPCECVLSTTTKAGFDLARRRYPDTHVFYCPLDFSWAVRNAMRRIKPDLVVLVELELWPNLIAEAARRDVPVAIVNGRLSEKSFRGYRKVKWLLASTLRRLRMVLAQSQDYADRFCALGVAPGSVVVTGSLKYDDVSSDRDNPETRRLSQLAGVQEGDIVFLAGSTQAGEEQAAIAAFGDLADEFPKLRLILVPRHPHRFDQVARELDSAGLDWQRRSELRDGAPPAAARVLLVDTIGELTAWWGTADIAYAGGSMGSRGGQNMIEPSAYGAAVSFGPNTSNFREVVELLLSRDAAVVLQDGAEMTQFVQRCVQDEAYRQELGKRARALVLTQSGAAEKTVECLSTLLEFTANSAAA